MDLSAVFASSSRGPDPSFSRPSKRPREPTLVARRGPLTARRIDAIPPRLGSTLRSAADLGAQTTVHRCGWMSVAAYPLVHVWQPAGERGDAWESAARGRSFHLRLPDTDMGRWAVQVFRMPHPAHQQPAPGADRVCVVAVADSGVVYAANNLLHGHTLGYVDRLPLAADETVSLLALLEVSGRRRAARLAAATTDGRVVDLDVADADANGTAFALRKRLLNRPAGYLAGIGRLLSWGAAASAATHSVGALFPIPAQDEAWLCAVDSGTGRAAVWAPTRDADQWLGECDMDTPLAKALRQQHTAAYTRAAGIGRGDVHPVLHIAACCALGGGHPCAVALLVCALPAEESGLLPRGEREGQWGPPVSYYLATGRIQPGAPLALDSLQPVPGYGPRYVAARHADLVAASLVAAPSSATAGGGGGDALGGEAQALSFVFPGLSGSPEGGDDDDDDDEDDGSSDDDDDEEKEEKEGIRSGRRMLRARRGVAVAGIAPLVARPAGDGGARTALGQGRLRPRVVALPRALGPDSAAVATVAVGASPLAVLAPFALLLAPAAAEDGEPAVLGLTHAGVHAFSGEGGQPVTPEWASFASPAKAMRRGATDHASRAHGDPVAWVAAAADAGASGAGAEQLRCASRLATLAPEQLQDAVAAFVRSTLDTPIGAAGSAGAGSGSGDGPHVAAGLVHRALHHKERRLEALVRVLCGYRDRIRDPRSALQAVLVGFHHVAAAARLTSLQSEAPSQLARSAGPGRRPAAASSDVAPALHEAIRALGTEAAGGEEALRAAGWDAVDAFYARTPSVWAAVEHMRSHAAEMPPSAAAAASAAYQSNEVLLGMVDEVQQWNERSGSPLLLEAGFSAEEARWILTRHGLPRAHDTLARLEGQLHLTCRSLRHARPSSVRAETVDALARHARRLVELIVAARVDSNVVAAAAVHARAAARARVARWRRRHGDDASNVGDDEDEEDEDEEAAEWAVSRGESDHLSPAAAAATMRHLDEACTAMVAAGREEAARALAERYTACDQLTALELRDAGEGAVVDGVSGATNDAALALGRGGDDSGAAQGYACSLRMHGYLHRFPAMAGSLARGLLRRRLLGRLLALPDEHRSVAGDAPAPAPAAADGGETSADHVSAAVQRVLRVAYKRGLASAESGGWQAAGAGEEDVEARQEEEDACVARRIQWIDSLRTAASGDGDGRADLAAAARSAVDAAAAEAVPGAVRSLAGVAKLAAAAAAASAPRGSRSAHTMAQVRAASSALSRVAEVAEEAEEGAGEADPLALARSFIRRATPLAEQVAGRARFDAGVPYGEDGEWNSGPVDFVSSSLGQALKACALADVASAVRRQRRGLGLFPKAVARDARAEEAREVANVALSVAVVADLSFLSRLGQRRMQLTEQDREELLRERSVLYRVLHDRHAAQVHESGRAWTQDVVRSVDAPLEQAVELALSEAGGAGAGQQQALRLCRDVQQLAVA